MTRRILAAVVSGLLLVFFGSAASADAAPPSLDSKPIISWEE